MLLQKAQETYYYNSGKAGDVGRQLALGGIAVVWLLHGGATSMAFPKQLLMAISLFLLSLALDFLQYLFGALIWGGYSRLRENQIHRANKDPLTYEFLAPAVINWLGLVLFLAKSIFLIGGGFHLGCYLVAIVKMAP